MHSITLISSRNIPPSQKKKRECVFLPTHEHACAYTCVCFQLTGSVYRSDYINLREGGRRTNSVKDKLHAQRNDSPSTRTLCFNFLALV